MDVFMYRRSGRGVNIATDVTASVLETRDIISLPGDMITNKGHAEQGKLLLGKLKEEMAMVSIKKSSKCSTVTTGDEINNGERSIRLSGEVYYK
ncbi:unnamed protein product [Coregonus sp. 'balchen']|nr:unnamed protein product [Coregonus sp. 'balchen']